MPGPAVDTQRLLQVVADPHRWRLMTELAHTDLRVGELTRRVGDPQNLVSYHLRELRDAGLVSSRRSSFDARDTYYRLELPRCCELLAGVGASLNPGLGVTLRTAAAYGPRRGAPRVLFLCTGNSARSQMAEALLEHLSGHAIQSRSAGSHPKALHGNAVRVMALRGIDISGRPTKHFRRFARAHFDQVVTLCDKVREVCPEFRGTATTAHWSIADPAAEGGTDEETLPAFERTADELEERIAYLIARLSTEGGRADVGRTHN